jgi:cell wall-associated NlpC family hydrolase
MIDAPAWTEPFVGLRFREGGRDLAADGGLDCYGLVAHVLRVRAGIVLPELSVAWVSGGDASALAKFCEEFDTAAIGWLPVRDGTGGACLDILWLRSSEPIHYGISVGGGMMLHIGRGYDSVCEPFRCLRWERRIMGIYRHESFATLR